jgi:hypothetical protein
MNCIDQYLILHENAFADKLGPLGFNPFCILVVNFMHECELSIWKALFTHLVCLLYVLPGGGGLVARLDNRFIIHYFLPCITLMVFNLGFAMFHHTAMVLFADLQIIHRK